MHRLSRRDFNGALVVGSLGAMLPAWADGSTTAAADGLLRSAPEKQGVDPRAILSFLDKVAAANLELHSFMLWRHGHVVAEGWWWPYRADRPHMMHSLTKSVAVCGVGLALAEGRFGIDDKVISFFKDELPAKVDDKLAAMSVRDLLTMQTGHAEEISGSVWRQITTSWVAEFFKVPVVHQPGTTFVYTSAASFMLSAIVTRTTGQRLRDYLEPRLFKPLGINDLRWDVAPGGINPGGNGLSWRTADSLKLGALHAQKGQWRGKQILPAKWIEAATRPQIASREYGYQWWMGPGKSYYALGLFTQVSIVLPEHDAVLAITSAIDGSKNLLPIVWKHFPAAFDGAKASPADAATLGARTAELRLLPAMSPTSSPVAERISGRTFSVDTNEDEVQSVRFDYTTDRCVFRLRDARGEHTITAGLRDWIEGDTSMTGNKLHHQYQLDSMRVVAAGRWQDAQTFEMTWQFVESAFRDRVVCHFDDGGGMTLDRSVNVNSAATSRPTLRGRVA